MTHRIPFGRLALEFVVIVVGVLVALGSRISGLQKEANAKDYRSAEHCPRDSVSRR